MNTCVGLTACLLIGLLFWVAVGLLIANYA